VREVEQLFVDAIDAAERLVYVETQYFSSRSIREALIERMRRRDRPRLEIVVVVNERAEALKEERWPGLAPRISKAATRRRRPTGLGLYFSRSATA
jgi:phosphatidylserine/phosphatidylglycerophosphate/cardiolipin synthase-like enzyme